MPTDHSDEQPRQVIINIVGEKVALGPIRRDLLPLYVKWFNDFDVTRNLLFGLGPMTWEAEEVWYEGASRKQGEGAFTIYERSTMRPIGNTDLHEIDHKHRAGSFGIVIGEKDCWNKGYGAETASLMLDYGFTALGLHNIMLTAFSYNERALHAYRRAGFKEFGRRRESRRFGGQAYDTVYMDCLATEFESRIMRQYLP